MEIIHKNSFFELDLNTVHEVRKLYSLEKEERIVEATDLLKDWINKQEHFTHKEYSKDYLERLIISCKGSVERAKSQLDKLCTLRTIMPKFFEKTDGRYDFEIVHKKGNIFLLPKLMKGFYRVGFLKAFANELDFELIDIYRYVILMMEYIKAHDYSNGIVVVLDYTDINIMQLIKKANILELRQALIIVMEGFGVRLKGIHIISSSTLIEHFITILKQLLSKKVSERIVTHKTKETLHDYFPKDILPVEYGGPEKSCQDLHDMTLDAISTKAHIEYVKRLRDYKIIENHKSLQKYNEEFMGMSGTFRTLSID